MGTMRGARMSTRTSPYASTRGTSRGRMAACTMARGSRTTEAGITCSSCGGGDAITTSSREGGVTGTSNKEESITIDDIIWRDAGTTTNSRRTMGRSKRSRRRNANAIS